MNKEEFVNELSKFDIKIISQQYEMSRGKCKKPTGDCTGR